MPNSKNTDKVSIVIKIHNSAKNQQAKSENSVRYRGCLSGFCSNFKLTREKKSRVIRCLSFCSSGNLSKSLLKLVAM